MISGAPSLSIVMPVLDEGPRLSQHLQALALWREAGVELVVVDGGSLDDAMDLAKPLADQVLQAPRGRASQMNAGAARARGDWLLFLHADTRLPDEGLKALEAVMAGSSNWGRFDVRIDSPSALLHAVGSMMNLRSHWSGIATGDQAIFVRRQAFEAVGGFPDIALMEDIALSRRLKRLAWPLCLKLQVRTSARRWEQHGAWRTIWLMWRLRAAYALGADPRELARRYGYRPRES